MKSIILPAIDIINGRCVRLTEGDPNRQKSYEVSPIMMAEIYEKAGATHLHIVDLDAALSQGNNIEAISEIITNTNLKIEIGGGIKSKSQVEKWLDLGAWRVIIGSAAVKNSAEVKSWIADFGSDKIVIGADTKDDQIMVQGWQATSKLKLEDFVDDYVKSGAQTFLCTDISKDGKLQGSAIQLYRKLMKDFPQTDFIASGGVSTLNEIGILQKMEVGGIIVGKAIFESAINLEKLFKL